MSTKPRYECRLSLPAQVWARLSAEAEARGMRPERLVVELVELQLVEINRARPRPTMTARASSPAAEMIDAGE